MHPASCACCSKPSAAAQSLQELDFGRSACHFAQCGDSEKLAMVLDSHAESIHSDGTAGHSGFTPLHYAARSGSLECTQLLLDKGCDVNKLTNAGHASALHRAAYMGHVSIVQLLLSRGACPGIQDSDGMTALHKASLRGHDNTCAVLMKADATLADVKTHRGLTCFDIRPTS